MALGSAQKWAPALWNKSFTGTLQDLELQKNGELVWGGNFLKKIWKVFPLISWAAQQLKYWSNNVWNS